MSEPHLQAWRLVKLNRVDTAFDGEGAFRFGGRWNSKGQRLVYASSTLALALLEIYIHIDPSRAVPELLAIPIEIPERMVERSPYSALDQISTGLPWPLRETRKVGDRWAAAAEQTALQIPSAIIPVENNYLINPAHPDFSRCRIGMPEPLPVDARLHKYA